MHVSIPAYRTRRLRRTMTALSLTILGGAAACGADEALGSDAPSGGNTTTPQQLVGEWVHGLISPTSYHDAYNGRWVGSAYGTSVIFKFRPDGKYEQSILIQTSAYNCRTQVFIYNEGRATFDGPTIRVYPTAGTVKARDTCVPANNFDRADDIARKKGDVYTWRFETNPEDSKTYLRIGIGANDANPSWFRAFQ